VPPLGLRGFQKLPRSGFLVMSAIAAVAPAETISPMTNVFFISLSYTKG
jgi:hypothetical protein